MELSFLLLGWISPFYLRTTFQSSGLLLISSSLLSSPFFLPLTSQPMKVGTPRWECLGQTPGLGKGLDLFRAVSIALQNHWKLSGIRKLAVDGLPGKPIAMGERAHSGEWVAPSQRGSRGSRFFFKFRILITFQDSTLQTRWVELIKLPLLFSRSVVSNSL